MKVKINIPIILIIINIIIINLTNANTVIQEKEEKEEKLFLKNQEEINYKEKIPIYLSIETDSNKIRNLILDFILDNLNILSIEYPYNFQIKRDIDDLSSTIDKKFHEPNSWHVTTYYIGQEKNRLDSPFYKNFIEDIKVDLNLFSFAYIPGNLIASPIFTDFTLIANPIPHMTLMLGEKANAVDSNFLLKSVFNYNEYLKILYKSKLIIDESYRDIVELKNLKVEYPNKTKTYKEVYFIKSKFYIKDIEGKTKINFDL
jgi:hypothetical protein